MHAKPLGHRKFTGVVAAVLACIGIGLALYYSWARNSHADWKRDFVFVRPGTFQYRLTLHQEQNAGDQLGGSVDLNCRLNVMVPSSNSRADRGETEAVLWLSDCARLTFNGIGLSPQDSGKREVVENHRIYAGFSKDGTLQALSAEDAEPGLGASLIRFVLLEALPALPNTTPWPTQWERDLTLSGGTFRGQFQVSSGEPGRIKRSLLTPIKIPGAGSKGVGNVLKKSYQTGDQKCEIVLSEQSGWDQVDCNHRFSVDVFKSDVSIQMRRESAAEKADVSVDLAKFKGVMELDPFLLSNRVRKKLLVSRVGSLTIKQLENYLLMLNGAAEAAPFGPWLPEAVALLELRPESIDLVASIFRQSSSGSTREMILDLLAGAGTAKAQSMMVTLISEATQDQSFAQGVREQWYQRLAMLENPDSETLQFALKQVSSAPVQDGDAVSRAHWVGLGALAGKRELEDPLHQAAVALISSELKNAHGSFTVEAMILAAGNTRDPSMVQAIKDAAQASNEASTRVIEAVSLGSTPGERAESALWELASDHSGSVAVTAVRALRGRDDESVLANWSRFTNLSDSPVAQIRAEVIALWEAHPENLGSKELKILQKIFNDPAEESTTRTRAGRLIESSATR